MIISEYHQDVLNELTNMGIGDASAILNEMVNCHVELTAPRLIALNKKELASALSKSLGTEISMVEMGFSGVMQGSANLLFSVESGKKLTNILSDDFDEEDYNTLKSGTLTEVGNIILNSVMASFANAFKCHLEYRIPSFNDLSVNQYVQSPSIESFSGDSIFLTEVNFSAEDVQIEGKVVLIFDMDSITSMLNSFEESDGE
jgi:chemotaxis protein CheC